MFDIEGSRRQSRMEADSALSFNSSTDLFRDSVARRPRRRFENNYHLGPNDKPVLSEFRQTIKEILETTCEGIDYELVDQANLVRSINSTLHKRIKDLIPKRYRFTLQSNLFEEKDQDIVIGSKWLWNTKTDNHISVKYSNATMTVVVVLHLIYLE